VGGVTASDERFRRFESLLSASTSDLASLKRLCVGCVEHLSASGAGVSVVAGSGHRDILFATDHVSAQIEELQVSLGEGPCIDAWSSRAPVIEPDLLRTAPGRWPVFGPAASAAGAAAVFAMPLQVGQARVGALDVYRDRPGGLSDLDVADAMRIGEAVTQVLLRLGPSPSEAGPGLSVGGSSFTAEVYQAAGMITVQLDMDVSEALARLRAHAYAEEQPLRDVARDVVARRLRIQRDR
jgi:GAF domain/ANTAR domain